MTQGEWWRDLPTWLKLLYLLVALPAWLFIVYCMLTNQNKSPAAYLAFGIFAATAALHIIFDRRPVGRVQHGVEAHSDGGGD